MCLHFDIAERLSSTCLVCLHHHGCSPFFRKSRILGLGGVPDDGGGCYGRSMRSREASWRYEREREEEEEEAEALLRYSVPLQFSAPALALVSASHWHDSPYPGLGHGSDLYL